MLVRSARLVPVAGVAVSSTEPVDLRIRSGRLCEIGAGLQPGPADQVFDAAGRWAVPGLWDQHVHMALWAQASVRLDVSGSAGPADVVAKVQAHLAGAGRARPGPPPGIVYGYGYRCAAWARPATVAELDAVSGGTPVVLVSGDAHNGWLNSAALRLLGLPLEDSPLDEQDWFPVLARLADLPGGTDGLDEAYAAAVQAAAARGVVGIVDMEFGPGYLDWPTRLEAGLDQLRVRVATYPDRFDDVIRAGLRTGQPLPGGGDLVTMGPLKIISDGSVNTGTALCCEPYAGPDFPYGKQNYPLQELTDLLAKARRHGLHAAVHAIGDAAVAVALDAFAATGARGGVEHAQLVATADLARMARLGVGASVQPAHLYDDRDISHACWPDRTDRCFPLRGLLDAGVVLRLGSDAPVAPLDPWLAMAAAVHRSGDDRAPWNPAQSLTVAEALAASTDGQGSLSVGSRGDLALLDHDPLLQQADSAATAAHLRSTVVAATFVGGRATHLAL